MDAIDVLAIDDDKLVHKIIRKSLEGEGFSVRSAFDGESGLEAAHKQAPHIILLDVEMPGMNGYQVCERLAEDPAFSHVPIVFLSSHSSIEERMRGYDVGADDYLVKPFETDNLLARMRVLLRYANEQKTLHAQVSLAQNTAMQALSSTSELGQAMSFMEKSLSFQNIEEAAEQLLSVTGGLGLDCRLMITMHQQAHWYPSEDKVSPLEKELIEMSDRQQRILDFGASTLVNYPVVSILTTNMPLEDPDRYGRIKDLLPLLLSGMSAKIYALETQEALQQHAEQLNTSITNIRSSLYHLGTNVLSSKQASSETLQNMVHKLQDDLLRMGLAEDEEQLIIERIDESAEHAIEQLDTANELGTAFRFVHGNLKHVAKQQHALSEAYQALIAQQQEQTDNANSGDIELF